MDTPDLQVKHLILAVGINNRYQNIPSNFIPHLGTYTPELDDLHIQLKQLLKKNPK